MKGRTKEKRKKEMKEVGWRKRRKEGGREESREGRN